MTREEEAVAAASARFYDALTQLIRGNATPMSEAWHQTDRVSSGHPFGDWAHGWEQVWATWTEIAQSARNGTVVARDVRIFVHGTVAYSTCVEEIRVSYGDQSASWAANVTNVFAESDGEWKMIHHHSDKVPAAEDVVEKMMRG